MYIVLIAVLLYVGMVNDEKEAEELDNRQVRCMLDKMEAVKDASNENWKMSCRGV